MLRLYTLGRLELARGDPPALEAIAAQPKRLALLAYLAVAAPGGLLLRRDSLLALLWPELGQDEARRALRQALHHLRSLLGDDVVVSRADETVGVAAERLWCDAVALDDAVAAGRPAEALALYQRPFLDGVFLPDVAPEYEQWVETTRERLRRRAAAAAWMLADAEERAGRASDAVAAARRAVELAPDDEPAVRRLMEVLARQGDRAGALRAYQELERRLAAEFDAKPSSETQTLAARLRAASAAGPTAAAQELPTSPPPTAAAPAPRADVLAPPRSPRLRLWMLSAGFVLAAGVAAFAALRAPRDENDVGETLIQRGLLAPRDRILVADFRNRTRDTLLAGAVAEAVRVDLAQSPVVAVMSTQQMRGALGRMERGGDAPVDDSLAQELAVREGVKAYVIGDVSSVGASYLVAAQLVATSGGQMLGAFRETAADSADLMPAIDRLSRRVRRRVGETLRLVRASPPLEQVTTPSLAALRAYSQGLRALYARGDRQRAIERLERAIEIDTGFAMAYRVLGVVLRDIDETGRSMDALSRAYAHRERLPFRERYLTVASYHHNVTHDADQAARAYRDLLDLYPDDVRALNNLGIIEREHHRFAVADTLLRRAAAADSTIPSILVELAEAQLLGGHDDEARATVDRLRQRFRQYHQMELVEAYFASARRDWASAERHIRARLDAVKGDTLDVIDALQTLGQIELAQGRLGDGGRALDSSLALSHAVPSTPRAYASVIALANADVAYRGDAARAARRAEEELTRVPLERAAPGERMYYEFARLFARASQPARARALIVRAERDTAVRARRLDTERHVALGAVALAEHRWRDAQRELREAEALDPCTICELPELAAAYELAGDTAHAIATYRRYLTSPWMYSFETDASNLGPSLGRLAALYDAAGRREEAATTRAELARLLKDADADVKGSLGGRRLAAVTGKR